MRRFPTTLVVLVVMVVGLIAGWRLFWPSETQRYEAVKTVRQQRSEIHLSEAIVHAKGPIAREELRLDNVEGNRPPPTRWPTGAATWPTSASRSRATT